jgi:hypothetical protein
LCSSFLSRTVKFHLIYIGLTGLLGDKKVSETHPNNTYGSLIVLQSIGKGKGHTLSPGHYRCDAARPASSFETLQRNDLREVSLRYARQMNISDSAQTLRIQGVVVFEVREGDGFLNDELPYQGGQGEGERLFGPNGDAE